MNSVSPAVEVQPLVFSNPSFKDHEQVVFCHDKESGLKAIIGVHSTVLGPALGGTRMWAYNNEAEALRDVLRLSRGMTFKASISGLNLGGGKAVIIGDSRTQKTEAMMRAFGRMVDRLGGNYITAEDVGIGTKDMEYVKAETNHVTGIPIEMGGSGDPSPVTAYGTYMGIKASAKYKWGNDNLSGKKVLVQGIGNVGITLVKHLTEAGMEVFVQDIHQDRIAEAVNMYGAKDYTGEFAEADVDIYAPCALGATVNDESIEKFKCSIIAGAANNQLKDEVNHGIALQKRGILYAPDFLINAGGLINVYSEIAKYDRAEAIRRTEGIYDTTLEIFRHAETKDITTHQAALEIAQARVDAAK
ncbi:MAG: Glu/Leu/Phe/Val dehydrogenase [Cryomorphaceae bacterium]|nr:Glu/Leu/Phe/Val dehydrogenase [Cryomorphaceae bacterium]